VASFAFDWTGGHLALDFANTVDGRHAAPTTDHLATYADLVEFARQAELVPAAEAQRLARLGAQRADAAAAVLAEAVALREALYRIFFAVAGEKTPQASDLAVLTPTTRASASTSSSGGNGRRGPPASTCSWAPSCGPRSTS
jgi:predicted RNA-binding Zn ribbon-like protein